MAVIVDDANFFLLRDEKLQQVETWWDEIQMLLLVEKRGWINGEEDEEAID